MKNLLQIGDKIAVNRGMYTHYGIYVGPRGFYGESVVSNEKGQGVRLISLQEFSVGQPILVTSRVINGMTAQEIVARRALSLIGTQYDLVHFNCEHFANYAQVGKRHSEQLGLAVVLMLVIGMTWCITRQIAT